VTEKFKLYWVYGISIAFIALNVYLVIHEFYWSLLLPVVVAIMLLYLFSLDKLLMLITFLTPLAVNVRISDAGLGVSLPTEPLMFGVLIVFILKILSGLQYDKRILKHPVTVAIMINLVWILLTSLTSEIPLVSIKFLIARLWFVVPFFFIGAIFFRKFSNIKLFSWLYVIPLMMVIFYTVINHAQYGFDEETGHWVMTPFYNDHTAYGAAIAMFIPIMVGFGFDKNYTKSQRFFSFASLAILTFAIILSYSRAAWISLVIAFGIYILVLLKIKFKWVFLTLALIVAMFFGFQQQIVEVLERNEQDSSTDLVEHVQSIYNISSDASNLERINRWQAAIRMFDERPVFGWGPGTYQFLYAPFQRSKEKTIISTNAGDLGNAHSEFIGPMAEQGLPGMIIMMVIVGLVIFTALKVYKNSNVKEVKMVTMSVMLGVITYFIHGLLNNFLDTDKASVPVWGFFAIIVALDIYHTKTKKETY